MMMHKESLLQFRSLMTSAISPANEQDTWLLSSLHGLACQERSDSRPFTMKILELLRKVSRFHNFERVAIVRRLGNSNQLQAVCASELGEKSANMKPGYSCFVDPKGSLFNMNQDCIRIYQSSKDVVKSYELNQKKPQRSIYKISQSSFNSAGYCIGLFCNTQLMGFFFANRSDTDDFGKDKSDYTIFSCLAMLAHQYLGQLGLLSNAYKCISQKYQNSYIGSPLDLSLLLSLIDTQLKEFNADHLISSLKINKTSEFGSTLVSHGNISQSFARLIQALKFQTTGHLRVEKKDETLIFSVEGISSDTNFLDDILIEEVIKDAQLIGQEIKLSKHEISVRCPYDGQTSELYSVYN